MIGLAFENLQVRFGASPMGKRLPDKREGENCDLGLLLPCGVSIAQKKKAPRNWGLSAKRLQTFRCGQTTAVQPKDACAGVPAFGGGPWLRG